MRNVFLISALVALVLQAPRAEALTVENVSVTETGGVSSQTGVTVTGDSDASSEVQTEIRGYSGGGAVKVEVTTERDGIKRTESRTYTTPDSASVKVNVETGVESTVALKAAEAPTTVEAQYSLLLATFDRIVNLIAKLFSFTGVFW